MVNEGKKFSGRLQRALTDAGYSAYGPTELARQFNLRFSGRPVSVHAARKWLMGDAIPTQDKVRVLAEWLVISAGWLRFGTHDAHDGDAASKDKIDPALVRLSAEFQRLDPEQRTLVLEFVRLLVRLRNVVD